MTDDPGEKSTTEAASTLPDFHYIKSNHFRVVHSDGAYGGVTPRGYIQTSFYSERSAIPRMMHGSEIVETRGGIVREIEVNVVMDINAAIEFHKWFKRKLTDLKKLMNIPDDAWNNLMRDNDE